MEKPLNPNFYHRTGKRTTLIFVNNDINRRLVENGMLCGYPVFNQLTGNPRTVFGNEVKKRYSHLLNDGKIWCPMSGVSCLYGCILSRAKEIYLTGIDFYRSNNRQDKNQLIYAGGSREAHLGSGSYNNALKDELSVKAMIDEGYPIVLDKVLTKIYE